MPTVQYLVLCDEVRVDPDNFLRLDVLGLLTRIRSTATPPFPLVRPLFRALVILTNCQESRELSLRLVRENTGRIVYRNQPRQMKFAGDPTEAVGLSFALRNCVFPAAGVYWMECLFDGLVIGRQHLLVKV